MATWLDNHVPTTELVALAIGLVSAVIDNVPLVAATMGMYSLDQATSQSARSSQSAPSAWSAPPAPRLSPAPPPFPLPPWPPQYPQDATLWQLIAYCAGTGGSILIIGSAAGVAFMGMEKADFGWYLTKVSPWALAGYLGGVARAQGGSVRPCPSGWGPVRSAWARPPAHGAAAAALPGCCWERTLPGPTVFRAAPPWVCAGHVHRAARRGCGCRISACAAGCCLAGRAELIARFYNTCFTTSFHACCGTARTTHPRLGRTVIVT